MGMYKIGLTGGICSGKTFVLDLLSELGCYTVRADDIAKEIVFANNVNIIEKIKDKLGPDIISEDNKINKEELARIVFTDDKKRRFINQLVHPLVAKERRKLIKSLEKSGVYDFFVYESAILVESGIFKDFDKVIVVYTTPEEQIKRLMERDNISLEFAEAKIKSQLPLSEKLKVAHYTIDTTGSFEIARVKTLETFHLLKKDFNLPINDDL